MPFDSEHAKVMIRLAEGRSTSLGKVRNRAMSWRALGRELETPTRSKERFKTYQTLSQDDRNKLKNINGWFLGGHCEGGRRAKNTIKERDVITFDMDDAEPDQLWDLKHGISGIANLEWFAHTTRSHTGDEPRIRIYFLLTEPISADRYDAATRILAHRLDESLDSIDDVSFRVAQLMYKPTCSIDGEFEFIHNAGQALDVQAMLDAFGPWDDYLKLPFSEKQGQRRPSAKKAEDPTTKHGIIGAFCRAYDVEMAIAKFIPNIYTPTDDYSAKPRYTYTLGSGANGVVVEDDGLFIYSHHGTDPCGERLCNAFDMVRLHKFEDQDEGAKADTAASKMPSFKAMVEFVGRDENTRRELVQAKYDAIAMFDDVDDEDGYTEKEMREDIDDEIERMLEPSTVETKLDTSDRKVNPPKPPQKNWQARELDTDLQGNIIPNLHNVATIIRCDPRLWSVVARNDFTHNLVARRDLKSKLPNVPHIIVEDRENGLQWSDLHDISIRAILEAPNGQGMQGWGLKVTDRDLTGAIDLAATHHRFNPVIEYFESLEWDGIERVETVFIDYLNTPDTPYFRETIRVFLMAAVARTYCPGHKFDTAPILSGPQGIRKSTFIKELFGEAWTGELSAHMASNKDAVEQMMGMLCLELPELSSMRKSEVEDVKHFMTIQRDRVRLSYDRRMGVFPRSCVLMGTTNAVSYLKDSTGNRRWWPIPVNVPMIDTDRLAANRAQIWAEAAHLYWLLRETYPKQKMPLYLRNREAIRRALEMQEEAREETAEEGVGAQIAEWLENPRPLSHVLGEIEPGDFDMPEGEPMAVPVQVCLSQLFCEVLGGDMSRYSSNRQNAYAMTAAMGFVPGWSLAGSKAQFPIYGRQRAWFRNDTTPAEKQAGYRIVGAAAEVDSAFDDIL